jgi:phosphate:Na+ symporter
MQHFRQTFMAYMTIQHPDISQLIAGAGLFLYGVLLLEKSLQRLMSRQFKLFLKNQTQHLFRAVMGGAIVTTVLQSSSAVNFMVLAFASAGVIGLENALGVTLGANIGTSLSNWLIVTLGFSLGVESLAYPLAGVCGIGLFAFQKKSRTELWLKFAFGFSLLFVGLDFMKTAATGDTITFWLNEVAGSTLLMFLIIGFVLTSITQSSTATIAITLSLLHAGGLSFYQAGAVVLGSEVGTSVKLLFGAMDGKPIKQQLAYGNFFFNLIVTIIVFMALIPAMDGIQEGLGIRNPVIGLVVFQSAVNVAGILLFVPFLGVYARFLQRLFRGKEKQTALYISALTENNPPDIAEELKRELAVFNLCALQYHFHVLHIKEGWKDPTDMQALMQLEKMAALSKAEAYVFIKDYHGELHQFCIRMAQKGGGNNGVQVEKMMAGARSTMYACKCIKDIIPNLDELENSSKDIKYMFYNSIKKQAAELLATLQQVLLSPETSKSAGLDNWLKKLEDHYHRNIAELYQHPLAKDLEHLEIADMLNVNREVFTASKALLKGVRHLVFTE